MLLISIKGVFLYGNVYSMMLIINTMVFFLVWHELNRIVKHNHDPVRCLETLIHILRGK